MKKSKHADHNITKRDNKNSRGSPNPWATSTKPFYIVLIIQGIICRNILVAIHLPYILVMSQSNYILFCQFIHARKAQFVVPVKTSLTRENFSLASGFCS